MSFIRRIFVSVHSWLSQFTIYRILVTSWVFRVAVASLLGLWGLSGVWNTVKGEWLPDNPAIQKLKTIDAVEAFWHLLTSQQWLLLALAIFVFSATEYFGRELRRTQGHLNRITELERQLSKTSEIAHLMAQREYLNGKKLIAIRLRDSISQTWTGIEGMALDAGSTEGFGWSHNSYFQETQLQNKLTEFKEIFRDCFAKAGNLHGMRTFTLVAKDPLEVPDIKKRIWYSKIHSGYVQAKLPMEMIETNFDCVLERINLRILELGKISYV